MKNRGVTYTGKSGAGFKNGTNYIEHKVLRSSHRTLLEAVLKEVEEKIPPEAHLGIRSPMDVLADSCYNMAIADIASLLREALQETV